MALRLGDPTARDSGKINAEPDSAYRSVRLDTDTVNVIGVNRTSVYRLGKTCSYRPKKF